MSDSSLAWLVARPIAHRGLHDPEKGPVENTLGAALAAIARGFSIECDVQLSRDGEAMVFHDPTLDRLTTAQGVLKNRTVAELGAVAFRGSPERIPTLSGLLGAIAGRVPLVCEIKSGFDGDMRLCERVAEIARGYSGPLALKSFDPAVIAHLRARAGLANPLGMVAEASYEDDYWSDLSSAQKRSCAAFLHYPETRPDFLSWRVDDLPYPTPALLRALKQIPVMVWTVRTPEQKHAAKAWADQILFEGEPD